MKRYLSDKVYINIPNSEQCYHSKHEYVMQVISPQPEGSIGGSDTHVLELAFRQKSASRFAPIVLFKRNNEYKARLEARSIAYISGIGASNDEIAEALNHLNGLIKITVIHSHQYDANFLTQTIKCKCSYLRTIPTVMTCHGWIENNEQDIRETARDFASYKYADALITVCEKDLKRIRENNSYDSKKVVCINNGVEIPDTYSINNASLKSKLSLEQKKVLVYVGRLAPEKRIDLILNMFGKLYGMRKDIVLLIVGNGLEREKLVNQACNMETGSKIIFMGNMENPGEVYSICDLIIMLSETEGTPRSILECMSYGKIAVSTNVGGVHEIIDSGEDGVLLDSNDPTICANIIYKLLQDPERLKKMGSMARMKVLNKFSINKMVERIENLYIELI